MHFINHFSGCQLCTEQNKNEDYKECETEFVKSFEYANSIMMKMLARKPARNITMHAQLAALPYCKVCRSSHALLCNSTATVELSCMLLRTAS